VSRSDNGPELTDDEWVRAVQEGAQLGTLATFVTGGELFARPGIETLLGLLTAEDVGLIIATNGTLIDRQRADLLASLRPWMVQISLHSSEPETHDRFVGQPGAHERAVHALMLLKERGLRLSLACMVTQLTFATYRETHAWAEQHGIHCYSSCVLIERQAGGVESLRLNPEQEARYYADCVRWAKEHPLPWTMPSPGEACGAGRRLCLISAQGDVFPCPSLPVAAGNIRDQDLGSIWTTGPIFRQLREWAANGEPPCPGCYDRPYCHRCWGHIYKETGHLEGCCATQRAQAAAGRQLAMAEEERDQGREVNPDAL
jgi:radical SAM protein with 4Fe4S-binding SPASM domain